MRHLPWQHEWIAVKVVNYNDSSFIRDPHSKGAVPSCAIYERCCRCPKVRVRHRYGERWELDELHTVCSYRMTD